MSTMIEVPAPPRFAAEPLAGGVGYGQDLEYVEKEIRNVLSDHPDGFPLTDFIRELWLHVPVPALSAAMLEMFDRSLIDLTPDRRLRLVSADRAGQ